MQPNLFSKSNRVITLICRPLLFLFLLILTACDGGDNPAPTTQIGQPAPPFELKDLNGTPHALKKEQGKVILLRFWSTQCKSCKEEMPKLEALYQKMKPFGITLIAVNIKDTPEETAAFTTGMGLTFPILIDENKETAKKYKVFGVPTSFVIDKAGVIRERFFGDLGEAGMEKLIRPLLVV